MAMVLRAAEENVMVQHLAMRLGRRGLVLVAMGMTWVLFGLSMLTGPALSRFSRPGPSPLDWMDSNTWGWLWLVSGATAAAVGLRRRLAPDAFGFAAVIAPAILWMLFYGYSFMVYAATGGEFGEPRTWSACAVWATVSLIIRVCAGWEDPSDPLLARAPEEPPRHQPGGGAQ